MVAWIEMYPQTNLLGRLLSWVIPSTHGWEEGRSGGTAAVAALDQGPNISWGQTLPMSPGGTKHGLYPSTLVLALLPGQEWDWLVQTQVREQKKLIGLLKWLKAVNTKYIKGCGRQFRLPAVTLLILIILWCVVRTASP